jgi:hypothetical protein
LTEKPKLTGHKAKTFRSTENSSSKKCDEKYPRKDSIEELENESTDEEQTERCGSALKKDLTRIEK